MQSRFNLPGWFGLGSALTAVKDDMLLCERYKGWPLFKKMLNDCYRYAEAVNAKGEPFPAEALLMALVFSQHKMIGWLVSRLGGRN